MSPPALATQCAVLCPMNWLLRKQVQAEVCARGCNSICVPLLSSPSLSVCVCACGNTCVCVCVCVCVSVSLSRSVCLPFSSLSVPPQSLLPASRSLCMHVNAYAVCFVDIRQIRRQRIRIWHRLGHGWILRILGTSSSFACQ